MPEDSCPPQVSLGRHHSAIRTASGRLWTWGDGSKGQLGHGEEEERALPYRVEEFAFINVKQVVVGAYHTAAVTDQGALYTWGDNFHGALGHGTEESECAPRRVETLAQEIVCGLACGTANSMCFTTADEVYSWGDGGFGELGHGDQGCEREWHELLPRRIEALSGLGVVQLDSGKAHGVCVTADRNLFSWGRGTHGQLGHGSEQNEPAPRLVQSVARRAKQVSAGAMHTAVVTCDNELYTWGAGEHGRLGHSDEQDLLEPRAVKVLSGLHLTQVVHLRLAGGVEIGR